MGQGGQKRKGNPGFRMKPDLFARYYLAYANERLSISQRRGLFGHQANMTIGFVVRVGIVGMFMVCRRATRLCIMLMRMATRVMLMVTVLLELMAECQQARAIKH